MRKNGRINPNITKHTKEANEDLGIHFSLFFTVDVIWLLDVPALTSHSDGLLFGIINWLKPFLP